MIERQVVLGAIEGVVKMEFRNHPDARLHFEFSDLPPDLVAHLEQLAATHPGLTFARQDGDTTDRRSSP